LHLEDGGDRWVPIFPELRPHLEEVFELAEPGAFHVITRHRGTYLNLRTQLQRIIRRPGLTAWPKLFQNLRASRQAALAAEYPLQVLCDWIGNSEAVAEKHHLQVTESDFDGAAGSAAKGGAVSACRELSRDDQKGKTPENQGFSKCCQR
jgi:hypothetical protein